MSTIVLNDSVPVVARKDRGALWRAYGLLVPLVVFLLLTFVGPIGTLLWRAVADTELPQAMPATALAVAQWDGRSAPDERLFKPLIADLKTVAPRDLASAARRLAYEAPTLRALLMAAKREAGNLEGSTAQMQQLDPRWLDNATWQTFKRASGPAGTYHLLSAVDMKHDYQQGLVSKDEAGLYRSILGRTFGIAAITTLVCVLLAFPLCAYLDRRTPRTRNALLLLILLPFWTSILVRTTAWMVLLQDQGIVNAMLMKLGWINSPLHLLYNRFGVILALVHVMLPFMVFPLLAAMSSCNRLLVQAAYSMGARPPRVFFQVYLPQVLPGLAAGALMVFIVTLGFYITPALLGGPADQMISFYIAQFTTGTLNWGLASALGMVLLVATTLLYLIQAHLARRTTGAK
ncbi:polyamine ABC transporter substrate-binding protein [Pseudomonas sp. S35]|uniref:ABC transporter permease n=1 Tax=Pseudomonas sp. S35 TaxID=1573719 RepID=UPI00132EE95A|nr:ABC transporter permease [Pseudomonas sp. S35]QHF44154.1 polyamine ABC transporter substrate-binding protein [Pseudomonas sp. S35]